MKNLENFENEQVPLDCMVGGDHVDTCWSSGDGSSSGSDVYDTERERIVYID